MRPPFPLLAAIVLLASPALAQPAGTPTRPVSTASPPGAAPTLDQRIDGAATLDSGRSPHDSGPLGAPLARGQRVTSPATQAVEKAGQPSGTPLGTGAAGPADAGPAGAGTTGGDPRNPG